MKEFVTQIRMLSSEKGKWRLCRWEPQSHTSVVCEATMAYAAPLPCTAVHSLLHAPVWRSLPPHTCDSRNATNCSSGFLILSSRDIWLLWIYLLLHQEPRDSVAFSITEREDSQQDPGRIITIIMVCPQLGATGLAFSPTCCWPALTHFIKAWDSHCFSPSVTLPVTLLHLLILFSGGVNTSPTAGE